MLRALSLCFFFFQNCNFNTGFQKLVFSNWFCKLQVATLFVLLKMGIKIWHDFQWNYILETASCESNINCHSAEIS